MTPTPNPDPPHPALADLESVDRRLTEAVAVGDWPRFRALLDEMHLLVDDPDAPAPPGPPPPPTPVPPATLPELKRALLETAAAKAHTRQQAHRLRETIARLDEQSRLAKDAGRKDLARQARQRRQNARRELAALDKQLANLEQRQRQLTQALRPAAPATSNPTVEAELAALKAAAAPAAHPEP